MIFEDLSKKTDKELYDRLHKLNERVVQAYTIGMDYVLIEQIQLSIETIQQILQERKFIEEWEKNKTKLESTINIDEKKDEDQNTPVNRRKRPKHGRRRIPTV